jgi:hypothetical protein
MWKSMRKESFNPENTYNVSNNLFGKYGNALSYTQYKSIDPTIDSVLFYDLKKLWNSKKLTINNIANLAN